MQEPTPCLLPSLINPIPHTPLSPQEIEALDNYDGEPWYEMASAGPPMTPGGVGGAQSSVPSSSFSDSPRASRTGSMAVLPSQATPPHMVARHDIMDVTIHLPVRACFLSLHYLCACFRGSLAMTSSSFTDLPRFPPPTTRTLILTSFRPFIQYLYSPLLSPLHTLNQDEVLPPGYTILAQTIGGNKGDLDNKGYFDRGSHGAFICYTRRGPQDQGPAIAELLVLGKAEAVPPGFELVTTTVGGKPLKEVMLAVRRQRYDAAHRYFEDRAVTGLYLVCPSKGESLPNTQSPRGGAFSSTAAEVEASSLPAGNDARPLSSSSSSSTSSQIPLSGHQDAGSGYHLLEESVSFKAGKRLFLVYRKTPCLMGLCEVTFKGEVLDRFPRHDHHDFALPHDVLPMFSYPKGIRIQRVRADKPPEPSYCSYVLTDEHGRNYYVASLTLSEPLSPAMTVQVELAIKKELIRRGRYKDHLESVLERCLVDERKKHQRQGGGGTGPHPHSHPHSQRRRRHLLVAPKVLICVSHWPVFGFMKKWLSQVYVLAMTQNPVPLERCIEHLVAQVPVPEAGGPPLSLQIHDMMEPIVLARPRLQGLPFLDLGFATLFRCLDVGNVLTVMALLLQERKVLVVAKYESVLTEAMEALRALLFPFKWESCYVPRMTESMLGCVEFPGGFLLGVRDDADEEGSSSSATTSSASNGGTSSSSTTMLGKVQHLLRDCDDVVLVDLGRNLVTSASPLLPVTFKSLPAKLRQTLQTRWTMTLAEADILPGSGFSSNPDHDLDFPGLSTATHTAHHQKCTPLNDRAIRDAALCFMLSLMKGYRDNLVVPDLHHGYREIFNKRAFLDQCLDKANRSFVVKMMGTQLFSSFIQRRTEASDPHLLFFDHCMTSYAHDPEAWGVALQPQEPPSAGAMAAENSVGTGDAPPVAEAAVASAPPSNKPRLLLIDRVESLELAASSSSYRVNSPSLKMMICRSSYSVGSSSPRASSLLSSSSSFSSPASSRLPPAVPTNSAGKRPGTGAYASNDVAPPFAPLGFLRSMSSSASSSFTSSSSSSLSSSLSPTSSPQRSISVLRPTLSNHEEAGMPEGRPPVVCRPSVEGLPPGELFSYCDHGYLAWPKRLDDKLFDGVRLQATSATASISGDSTPSSGGRTAHDKFHHLHDGHMAGLLLTRTHLELSQDEQDLNMLGSDGDSEPRCVFQLPKCLALHFYGSWFMCLPLLVQSAPEDEKEDLIVRAFGVLAAMQADRQVSPDETIYRALLVAIVRSGDVHCHRSDAVHLLRELTALGIKPNAITYGQYTRAIAEDYARKNTKFLGHVEAPAPSALELVRDRAPLLYLSFLDDTRRQQLDLGTRWRQGLLLPPADPGGSTAQHHRLSRSPSYPPPAPSSHHRRKSSSLSTSGSSQHHHHRHLPEQCASSAVRPETPSDAPNHAAVVTSWSFALDDPMRTAALDAHSFGVVAVSNGVPCACAHIMLDEELTGGWHVAEGLEGLAMVSCTGCEMPFHPQLQVRCSSFDAAFLRRTFSGPDAPVLEDKGFIVVPEAGLDAPHGIKRQGSFKGLSRRSSATGAGEGEQEECENAAASMSAPLGRQGSALQYRQLHRLVVTLLAKHTLSHSSETAQASLTALVEGYLVESAAATGGRRNGNSSSGSSRKTGTSSSRNTSTSNVTARTPPDVASLFPGLPASPASNTGNGTASSSLSRRMEGLFTRRSSSAAQRMGTDGDDSQQRLSASPTRKQATKRPLYCVTTQCSYMSPVAMRLGLEHLIKDHGEHALYRETMLALCPDLFWNLWWYSARFGLPLPLAALPHHEKGNGSAAAAGPFPHLLLISGWDAALVDKAAQAGLLILQAFEDHKMAHRLRDVLKETALAAITAAATLAAMPPLGLPSHLSSSSLDTLASSTTSLASAGSSITGAAVATRKAELLELLTTQAFQQLRGDIEKSDDGGDMTNDVAGLIHAALRGYASEQLSKARDTPFGRLHALVQAGVEEGSDGGLGPAVRFFLTQRRDGGDPLFQQGMYRILSYLADKTPLGGARGKGSIAGACRVGSHHERCSSGEDNAMHGTFEQLYTKACGEISNSQEDEGAEGPLVLRLPMDADPTGAALASRSVFKHLF